MKFKEPMVGIDIGRKRTGTFSGELSGLCGKRGIGSLHPCAMQIHDIASAKSIVPLHHFWHLSIFYA